jgi:hypothetical protein
MTKTRKKATAKRTVGRAKRSAPRTAVSVENVLRTRAKTAGARIRVAWTDAVAALGRAQANLEGEMRRLLRRNKISTKDAATMLKDLRALAERERQKAARELRAGAAKLQSRVQKERKVAGRAVDEAVRSALAALNIPSRAEVAHLTRKVEELTTKISRQRE